MQGRVNRVAAKPLQILIKLFCFILSPPLPGEVTRPGQEAFLYERIATSTPFSLCGSIVRIQIEAACEAK
jgi:hypothetical protein